MINIIQIVTLRMYFSSSSNLLSVTYTTGGNHTTIIHVLIGLFHLFYSFDLGVIEQISEAGHKDSTWTVKFLKSGKFQSVKSSSLSEHGLVLYVGHPIKPTIVLWIRGIC